LRGELISHLDRLRTELEAGKPDRRIRRGATVPGGCRTRACSDCRPRGGAWSS